ncbi:MAG TPA: glycosyltransferase [Candidatus Dormibacteraeota bacterium]|jgi:glycosyltransferase involved in cell wall biosynthesis
MRILMLAPEPVYTPRGTPISVINRCRALAALGHRVDLVTYPIGDDVAIPGLRFIRTPRLPGLSRVRIGPSLAKLPLDGFVLLAAVRQLLTNRYDVLHTHEEAGVMGWLLRGVFRLPHVHDIHCDMLGVLRDYGFRRRHPLVLVAGWLERRALQGAEALIVVFPRLVPAVRQQAPRTPVHLVNNTALDGLADAELVRRLRARWGLRRPVILYAGTLEPYQGIPRLLEAMRPVRRALPEARLVLVGGRPEQVEETARLATRLDVAGSVTVEGQRPAGEIPSYVAAADVLVSPRLDGINTPLKLYTYLRAGRPIVATRTESHLQILNERCAVLVDLGPDAIAEGLIAVLRDRALAHRLSLGAAERAKDFGIDRFLRETAAVYEGVGAPAPTEPALRQAASALTGSA